MTSKIINPLLNYNFSLKFHFPDEEEIIDKLKGNEISEILSTTVSSYDTDKEKKTFSIIFSVPGDGYTDKFFNYVDMVTSFSLHLFDQAMVNVYTEKFNSINFSHKILEFNYGGNFGLGSQLFYVVKGRFK